MPIFFKVGDFKVVNESFSGTRFKTASLAQCILKAVKPNSVIPPLLIELGVELDHANGSKHTINRNFKVGIC